MNVILKKDVAQLGVEGQQVRVAGGFYRNYLKPRNLAVEADSANVKWVEAQKQKAKQRLMEERERAAALAGELEKLELRVRLKAGENDRLFGSVTAIDIADKLKEQGYEIDRRKIHLGEPIKQLGQYSVPLRIHAEVEAKLNLHVEKEEEAAAEA